MSDVELNYVKNLEKAFLGLLDQLEKSKTRWVNEMLNNINISREFIDNVKNNSDVYNKNNFVNSDEIVDVIINNIYEVINKYNGDMLKDIGIDNFFKEFGIIKIQFPRQCGTTILGWKLIDKLENNIVRIVNKLEYVKHTKSININTGETIYELKNKDVLTFSKNNIDKYCKKVYSKEIAIIDDCRNLSIEEGSKIDKILIENGIKCIIKLG